MKKFGILCLALVMAIGALGVGYAAWTDEIIVDGTMTTGDVCFGIDPTRVKEYGDCPDQNFKTWDYNGYSVSCPQGYIFGGIHDDEEGKCPATVSFSGDDNNGDGYWEVLYVTINDAYPYFLADISFWACNCGTIPIVIKPPVILQSNFLLIEYGDNIGRQLHPGECAEFSFFVGVTQHEGYEDPDTGRWIIDDESMPLCPQETPLTFSIAIDAIQWNEY